VYSKPGQHMLAPSRSSRHDPDVRFGSMLAIKSATSSARATIESKYRVF
jgi:hypothetical protein